MPVVVTYHPLLNSLRKVLCKNLDIIGMDEKVKKMFCPRHLVSFRSARKVSSYFFRAKLYPLQKTVDSIKYVYCSL